MGLRLKWTYIWIRIRENWGAIVIALLSAAILWWIEEYYIKPPDLEVVAHKEKVGGVEGIEISVRNNKKFIGYGKDEIFYWVLIPSSFLDDKKIHISTFEGDRLASATEESFKLWKGEIYRVFSYYVNFPLYPKNTSGILWIEGDFSQTNTMTLCSAFFTEDGNDPSNIELTDGGLSIRVQEFEKFKCKEEPLE